MKDRIGPLISRISPVLKRKSMAQSPSREIASESCTLDASEMDLPHTPKEDHVNMSCSIDSSLALNEGQSSLVEEIPNCSRCKSLSSDFKNLQEEKGQSDKQLVKAREEAQMLSDLIKDMEHKWTEVAKDYEKQVAIHNSFYHNSYAKYLSTPTFQVDTLFGNIEDVQGQLKNVTSAFNKFRNQAQETLRQLHFDRKSVSSELHR